MLLKTLKENGIDHGFIEEGSDGMKELSGFIRESAAAFLKREHIVNKSI